MPRLILASSSPRRFDLLSAIGLPFEVARPDIDETPLPDELPQNYVLRLSLNKSAVIRRALTSDRTAQSNALILSADTTVVHHGRILGKPDSPEHAVEMLRDLRGQSHFVYTAITLVHTSGKFYWNLTQTEVLMRDYSDDEIAAYVASGDPLDKAGSYAIQNAAFHPVTKITGCYANVVGLPICEVVALLAQFDVNIPHVLTCSTNKSSCQFA